MFAVATVFFTLCFRLGYCPLLPPDEGRNAEVAREMKESGSWLVPTYNGMDYLDKPAFYFKAVALSLAAFGDNETAARLPSAVFGVGIMVMIFAFSRRVHGPRLAWLSVIVVSTTPLFLMNARTVIFDIALAFFVCGAIFTGYLAEEADSRQRRNWYLLGAASTGFATLVKGPVGFLIPLLVLLIFNLVEKRRGVWRRLLSPMNFAVFFIITLPWFVGLCLAHPDFLHYGLVEETLNRFTSTRTFHRGQPFYFYALIVAVMFFPWSLVLPEGSVAALRGRWTKHRADRLCLVWCVVVVLFFSISQSKLPGYVLTATVACGILVARVFDAALAKPEHRTARVLRRATVAFGVVCLLLAVAALVGGSRAETLAKPLRITTEDAQRLHQWSVVLAIVPAVCGAFALAAAYRGQTGLCFLSFALWPPLFIHVNGPAIRAIFDAKSARALADELRTLPPETEIVCFQCFPAGLPFYLKRTVTLVSADGGELTSNFILFQLAKNTQWPTNLLRLEQLDDWLATRKAPVFLLARNKHEELLRTRIGSRVITFESLPLNLGGARLPAAGGL